MLGKIQNVALQAGEVCVHIGPKHNKRNCLHRGTQGGRTKDSDIQSKHRGKERFSKGKAEKSNESRFLFSWAPSSRFKGMRLSTL